MKKIDLNIKRIYCASEDGGLSKIFHEKCDGIFPTITIIQSEYDQIFGGYTDCSWDTKGKWIGGKGNSFLF